MTGIGRCGNCRGTIIGGNKKRGQVTIKAYGCAVHHTRGPEACPVTVRQPMDEVEAALIGYLQHHVLTPPVLDLVLAEIRQEIAAQMPQREADLGEIENELRAVRAEQRKLAKAVALADDIPELVTELRQRSARIVHLETQLEIARRTPQELAAFMATIEDSARAKLADLRAALADREDLRTVFLALFPEGLLFTPVAVGPRQVWKIQGAADLGRLPELDGSGQFNLRGDPSGT